MNWSHTIEACLRGDAQEQEKLYRHCYAPMMMICKRYSRGDSEEAGSMYNQAMLKVFSNLSSYRGEGHPEAWIRKIVVNCCIDQCRRRVSFRTDEINDQADILQVVPEAYQRIAAAEVMKLLNDLPPNTALVFNLFVLEGFRHDEIWKMLGIATGTSKWHLNEARRLLKIKLDTFLKTENLTHGIRTSAYR